MASTLTVTLCDMGNPTPPAGTGPSGRALWHRIVSDLDESLEFDQRDIEVLTQACRLADRIRELADAVAVDGALIPGAHGPRLHPAVSELRQSEIALTRHLGLIDFDAGAAGRSRLSVVGLVLLLRPGGGMLVLAGVRSVRHDPSPSQEPPAELSCSMRPRASIVIAGWSAGRSSLGTAQAVQFDHHSGGSLDQRLAALERAIDQAGPRKEAERFLRGREPGPVVRAPGGWTAPDSPYSGDAA